MFYIVAIGKSFQLLAMHLYAKARGKEVYLTPNKKGSFDFHIE